MMLLWILEHKLDYDVNDFALCDFRSLVYYDGRFSMGNYWIACIHEYGRLNRYLLIKFVSTYKGLYETRCFSCIEPKSRHWALLEFR